MKHLTEYRDASLVRGVLDEMHRILKGTDRPLVIMEICGGQTHSIMRYGLDQMLPSQVELVHGPGCPVCVTSLELVDKAIAIASQPGVIFTSYGDMLRVPGTGKDLSSVRAQGGDVRVVYSPLDAVRIARENPDKRVVFFAIGFETTAPANAMSVLQAKAQDLNNFSVLVSHMRVPPAIHAILSSPGNRVQAFMAAGHVCTVMGYWEYPPIAQKFGVPIVITGFEPLDISHGILMAVKQLVDGRVEVKNAYTRAVTFEGNRRAQAIIQEVFMDCDRKWRGIGTILASGWCLKPEYASYDAEKIFAVDGIQPEESPVCISGLILQGLKKPPDCPAFSSTCTPERPLGATMVSSEGACAAYYKYSIRLDPSYPKTDVDALE